MCMGRGVHLHPCIYVWGLWGVWECERTGGKEEARIVMILPSACLPPVLSPRFLESQPNKAIDFATGLLSSTISCAFCCDILRCNNDATCAWHSCPAFFFLHFIIFLPPCTLLPSRFQRPHFLHTIAQVGVISFYACMSIQRTHERQDIARIRPCFTTKSPSFEEKVVRV